MSLKHNEIEGIASNLPSNIHNEFLCEYLDPKECNPDNDNKICPWYEICRKPDGCFAVWTNITGRIKMKFRGCWENNIYASTQCVSQSQCIATDKERHGHHFCCCRETLCNADISYNTSMAPVKFGASTTTPPLSRGEDFSIFIAMVPIMFLSLVILIGYWLYRRRRLQRLLRQGPNKQASMSNGVQQHKTAGYGGSGPGDKAGAMPAFIQPDITPVEIMASGRFGTLWRGIVPTDGSEVAVKILKSTCADSWMQEQEIYNITSVRAHPNILQYRCATRRAVNAAEASALRPRVGYAGMPTQQHSPDIQELWIVTEYHPHGSLYDYLKANIITLTDFVRFSVSMLEGLAFLHEEIPADIPTTTPPTSLAPTDQGTPPPPQSTEFPSRALLAKPIIVHRDFKSQNVLVKNDLTACIADFGLALKCDGANTFNTAHAQVGTRRYMAPELLEGAANANVSGFCRMDVYAAAIVVWEIMSRVQIYQQEPVPDYQLPFSNVLSPEATQREFCTAVSANGVRPKLRRWPLIEDMNSGVTRACPSGHAHVASGLAADLALIRLTMTEMWDSDPVARITAGCAKERLATLATSVNSRPSILVLPQQQYDPPEPQNPSAPLLSTSHGFLNDASIQSKSLLLQHPGTTSEMVLIPPIHTSAATARTMVPPRGEPVQARTSSNDNALGGESQPLLSSDSFAATESTCPAVNHVSPNALCPTSESSNQRSCKEVPPPSVVVAPQEASASPVSSSCSLSSAGSSSFSRISSRNSGEILELMQPTAPSSFRHTEPTHRRQNPGASPEQPSPGAHRINNKAPQHLGPPNQVAPSAFKPRPLPTTDSSGRADISDNAQQRASTSRNSPENFGPGGTGYKNYVTNDETKPDQVASSIRSHSSERGSGGVAAFIRDKFTLKPAKKSPSRRPSDDSMTGTNSSSSGSSFIDVLNNNNNSKAQNGGGSSESFSGNGAQQQHGSSSKQSDLFNNNGGKEDMCELRLGRRIDENDDDLTSKLMADPDSDRRGFAKDSGFCEQKVLSVIVPKAHLRGYGDSKPCCPDERCALHQHGRCSSDSGRHSMT